MRSRITGLLLALALLAAVAVVLAGSQKMSLQVKKGQLRATPSFLGAVVANLSYGDRVTVVKKKVPWFQVRDDAGQTGWIHQSALTEKRIKMTAGDADAEQTASGDELALAGKGFNSDVEAEFKQQNQEIDFTWVDRMEDIVVTPEEATRFLAEGKVEPQEGGAR